MDSRNNNINNKLVVLREEATPTRVADVLLVSADGHQRVFPCIHHKLQQRVATTPICGAVAMFIIPPEVSALVYRRICSSSSSSNNNK